MAYGWLEIEDADDYFALRLNAGAYWTSGAPKAAALQTAYNDLRYCGLYTFPETVTQEMKDAQCEQALFRLQQGEGLDRRAGIRAQGVFEAGVVEEKYYKGSPVALAPIVSTILKTYVTGGGHYFLNITRTDDYEKPGV